MLFRPNNNLKSSRNDLNQKRRLITFLIVFVIFLAIVFIPIFRNRVTTSLNFIGRPLWVVRESFRDKFPVTATYFTTKKSIKQENLDLKIEINDLRLTGSVNVVLENEISDLRELLSMRPNGEKRVSGLVLSQPPDGLFDTLIIGIGRKSGISIGDYVYAKGDIVLGIVQEVYSKTSKVILFSSGNMESDVFVGRESLVLLATGEGSGNFSIEFPADINIKKEDFVLLRDENGSILAKVSEVITTPGGSISVAIARSPANINSTRFVEVATKND